MRWIRHWLGRESVGRVFPTATLDAIQSTIADGERAHLGEVCFAIEGGLPFPQSLGNLDVRQRAEAAFARLRIWNTEHNSGVLVYVLLAEHAIEIVADRGIAARMEQAEWQAICAALENAYRAENFVDGTTAAIAAIHAVLTEHFPATDHVNPDELPNRPVLL